MGGGPQDAAAAGLSHFERLPNHLQEGLTALHAKAPEATQYINDIADKIAQETGSTVAYAPPKKIEKAALNLHNKQNYDLTKVRDLARNTVVTPDMQTFSKVYQALNGHGSALPEASKIVDAATDPLGYSGGNVKIKAPNGLISEIQVNTPQMIYAKESEENARNVLGDKVYEQMKAQYGDGGMGHKYYDEWAALPSKEKEPGALSTRAQAIADKSKTYYNRFK